MIFTIHLPNEQFEIAKLDTSSSWVSYVCNICFKSSRKNDCYNGLCCVTVFHLSSIEDVLIGLNQGVMLWGVYDVMGRYYMHLCWFCDRYWGLATKSSGIVNLDSCIYKSAVMCFLLLIIMCTQRVVNVTKMHCFFCIWVRSQMCCCLVTKVRLSCYLVLLSNDSKTR